MKQLLPPCHDGGILRITLIFAANLDLLDGLFIKLRNQQLSDIHGF